MSTPACDADALRACREVLERSSKSFALAARLLSPRDRDRVAAVYAFCRLVDDAIDGAPSSEQPLALARLEQQLTDVYGAREVDDPMLRAFQTVVRETGIPRVYPAELLAGMAMDVFGTRYDTLEELLCYCHRVAGVVGLMLCHVLGITRDEALANAAHLGIAMQLTNICRDVQEDWALGRLYLPRAMLADAGALELDEPGEGPFPSSPLVLFAMAQVERQLLAEADRYYASARSAISALPFRAGLGVRAASMLYRAIGEEVAALGYDPSRGRAYVSLPRKLWLLGRTLLSHAARFAERVRELVRSRGRPRLPGRTLHFPDSILR